ncbi:hypothetical protein E2C01_002644 [Portunus trituberculatus]|uniref:Uncharacterized protein n=1 Tax=Portunus trituberculatus TaxID=210409 RepID=A0A5B7CKG6_PORTR|nr:hypothetical protein [Portunus trituberculatus]
MAKPFSDPHLDKRQETIIIARRDPSPQIDESPSPCLPSGHCNTCGLASELLLARNGGERAAPASFATMY